LGFINDLLIDIDEGHIKKIIVPGPGRVLNFFGKEVEYHVPWDAIEQIGDDLIIVDCETKKIIKNIEY